ncbi:minor tail protein [Mycobacterium phage Patt]|uniref:Minor tail protein n=1 Tax=Mycobacterium phage Patt TaxID=2530139 RepID=A0A481VRM6_9CAUD|nr:minor tail protein [Mycobacterium phage Patt]QBI96261.1 minor tail protein [Mycobacterium phage Patt]
MPRQYDLRPVVLDRNPLWSLYEPGIPKLPELKLDPEAMWEAFVNGVKLTTGLDLSSPQALVESIGSLILTGGGIIDPSRLPLIPLANIGRVIASLLPTGHFSDPAAVDDDDERWTVVEDGGPSGSGAVKFTADGTIADLYSTDLVPVVQGEKINVVGKLFYENLVASGDPIVLGVTTYADRQGKTLVEHVDLIVPETPSGTLTEWLELSDTYTVPAGVRSLRVRMTVGADATAGDVYFAEVDANKGDELLPMEFVSGLLGELAARLGLDVWQDFLDSAAGQAGGTIHHIIDRIVNLDLLGRFDASQLTNLPNIPTIPGTNVGGVGGSGSIVGHLQETWNNFWGALVGRQADDDVSLADPTEQIAELASTTAAHSSAIAQLMANQDGDANQGVVGGDDFERVAVGNLGGGWAEFYALGSGNGYYDISNGHEAVWHDQGANTNTGTFVRTDPADERTETDYQRITFVVGTVAGEQPLPFIGTGGQHIRLWARVNDDADTVGITDGVFIEVGGASLAQFGYRKAGTTTMVGSTVSCTWGVGTQFTIDAGTADGVEHFRFSKNGSPILAWEDSSGVTSCGENFRRWGWEGQAQARGLGQGTPSSCARITIADNTPTAVYGTTMRVFRTNTSGVSCPQYSGQEGTPLPANVFDSIAYKSADLDWNPATNTVTFNTEKPATYHVQCRIEFSSALGLGAYLLVLYKNGVVWSYNMSEQYPLGFGFSDPRTTIIGDFTVYAEPGDTIRMYRINTDAKNIVGGFGGAVTFLNVAKMG